MLIELKIKLDTKQQFEVFKIINLCAKQIKKKDIKNNVTLHSYFFYAPYVSQVQYYILERLYFSVYQRYEIFLGITLDNYLKWHFVIN